jgi:hypothetical protein
MRSGQRREPDVVKIPPASAQGGVATIRQLLAEPNAEDGLPAFLPLLDEHQREVWVERSVITDEERARAFAYARALVARELGAPRRRDPDE